MTRHAALQSAARWALRDGEEAALTNVPAAAPDVLETLDDPALAEALAQTAAIGRLSDEDIRTMRSTRRRAMASGAVAMLLFSIGIGGWSNGWFEPPVPMQHYETQRGQRLTVTLADGSTINLNGATSLDVQLADKARSVEMRSGQAYFDIAHDAARPFSIHAGPSNVRVLGTAFDIDMGREDVRLAVYRGKVRFGSKARPQSSVLVPAGWRSRYVLGAASTPERFDAAQQDWRQNWVNTDAMALEDLVDELNRQGGPVIQSPPPALAQIALSGRFKLDNPEQLLAAIGSAYGFAVERQGNVLTLVQDSERPSTN